MSSETIFEATKMSDLITILYVAVIPSVIFSFWKVSRRSEFKALRNSGQKINLNLDNLRAAYRRAEDDPLRERHIRLARIGFVHWLMVPVGFVLVTVLSMLLHLAFN